ncbi:DUF721 domain-containing protein [Plastoroseomonas hellenica]|uniref:DUF721 domain-containing protein n=1 Tax=Plastoroseomonas hellenica TaxID=2687306 RepID=UPI001BAD80C0|nr:DUF721 domain-containing protein [Plastoroseomonas hellenica]MBR0647744.1 DUF721 domain-containing protein [Plastoroseomonas hellenica]
MTADNDRFFGGPRPLGAILPRLTRPAFKRRSPAGAQLMADWPAVIGPALAAVSVPKRLSAGTLTLACSGPIAMELTHLAPELIARINAHLGGTPVQRLRFVQEAPRQATIPPPRPEPQLPARVAASLTEVRSEPLRAALEKLARGVYRTRG